MEILTELGRQLRPYLHTYEGSTRVLFSQVILSSSASKYRLSETSYSEISAGGFWNDFFRLLIERKLTGHLNGIGQGPLILSKSRKTRGIRRIQNKNLILVICIMVIWVRWSGNVSNNQAAHRSGPSKASETNGWGQRGTFLTARHDLFFSTAVSLVSKPSFIENFHPSNR